MGDQAPLVDIGIVAHTSRLRDAHWLANHTEASFLGIDDGKLGCNGNHKRTWKQLAHSPARWAVVLEDDAILVDDFMPQLRSMLQCAPAPVISLYLGTSYPGHWQGWIQGMTQQADDNNACFILAPKLFHAVGVAMHRALVIPMLSYWATLPQLPVDEGISRWAELQHHQVAYCWPSLLDHRDGPTVATHRDCLARTKPRKAWHVGARAQWQRTTV